MVRFNENKNKGELKIDVFKFFDPETNKPLS